MERIQIPDKLKQARRALDSLLQVKILDDWNFDNELKVWFLHLGISIKYETSYFPQLSQWYVIAEENIQRVKLRYTLM